MQARTIAGIMVIGVLSVQTVLALSTTLPSRRDENRQALIADEGPAYNPNLPTLLRAGTQDSVTESTVTWAQAIEAHLDFYDRYNIRLADVLAKSAAPPNPHPITPAGRYLFAEKGYRIFGQGAPCPTFTPAQEAQVRDLMTGAPFSFNNGTVGLMDTTLSKYPDDGTGHVNSILYWYKPDNTGPTADDSWTYTGWALKAGGAFDSICTVPQLDHAKVRNDSIVRGGLVRTDPPT
jgi:hypothetical protein